MRVEILRTVTAGGHVHHPGEIVEAKNWPLLKHLLAQRKVRPAPAAAPSDARATGKTK